MTIHEAQQRLVFELYAIYNNREAANIADLVMEHITGWKKIDRIVNKQVPLLPDNIRLLEQYASELITHKPVQYVLNEAWFHGLKFFVNEHVLIPRPETEELVEWVVSDVSLERQSKGWQLAVGKFTMLDIGTGSGCIPIAIKKQIPSTEVFGCDISIHALEVAQKNAVTHQADIGLLQMNFLDPREWENLPMFDIIVSNPPYIPLKDQETMQPNVLLFEPHLALFVENNDPLVFYKTIARFAKEKMKPGGSIYVEIHEALGKEVMRVFSEEGFGEIELKKDMQGKERMIRVSDGK